MAEANHKISFDANPIQKKFIESQALADLFSSRVGEGKSAALAWSSLYHARHNPGADHIFIRDTWANLQATTLKEFFKWFPPGLFGTWKETTKTFTWAEGVGRGTVCGIGLDDPTDASKLQSRELAGIFMDEPAPASHSGGINELIFDIGFTRLRQPEMNWYTYKLATNNPDESHWTYKRFVDPGTEGFQVWQPNSPENFKHLPKDYYENLRRLLSRDPSLVDRFVDGKYGFQQVGQRVTPEWNDLIHLSTGLVPIPGQELILLWDFGLNPTCIITQITPMRRWLILESFVGDGIGVEELIEAEIASVLHQDYAGFKWRHIGDPNGYMREQSSSSNNAVRMLQRKLGGRFTKGPKLTRDRIDPLRAALRQNKLIQVDRVKAKHVWHCLRGGWFYPISNAGIQGKEPVKNIHSHPGDALGYGAAVLFPLGQLQRASTGSMRPAHATFFGQPAPLASGPGPQGFPYAQIPEAGRRFGG